MASLLSILMLLPFAVSHDGIVHLNKKFESSRDDFNFDTAKITSSNIYRIRVDFECLMDLTNCHSTYKKYRFYMITRNESEIMLKISIPDKDNQCVDSEIPQENQVTLYTLNLEIPVDEYKNDPKGIPSFIEADRVVYKFAAPPNSSNTAWRGTLTLEIPQDVRSQIRSLHGNEVLLYCSDPPPEPIFVELDACRRMTGEISAHSRSMVAFRDVDLVSDTEKIQFAGDLQFLCVWEADDGSVMEDYLLDQNSNMLRYNGKEINQIIFLPKGATLKKLKSFRIEADQDEICNYQIDQSLLQTVSQLVDRIPFGLPDPPLIKEDECRTPESVMDGSFNVFGEYKEGSTAIYTCDEGFKQIPKDGKKVCQMHNGALKWTGGGIECVKMPNSCEEGENYCRNGGWCTEEDEIITCNCPDFVSGDLCENVFNPCENNPCINGACISDGEDAICECESGFEGKFCEPPAETAAKCGKFSRAVEETPDGYQCECIVGYMAVKNSICVKNYLASRKCLIPAIPNGRLVPEGETHVLPLSESEPFLLPGDALLVTCIDGFRKTMNSLVCKDNGELTSGVSRLCVDSKEAEADFKEEQQKAIRWYFFALIGLLLCILILLAVFVYVAKW